MDVDKSVIVTLVHGTWSKDPEWAKDESPLVKGLKEGVEGVGKVQLFKWSGNNRQSSRLDASDKLIDLHKEIKKDNEEIRHYVIGHSHGGNVAMFSLKDDFYKNTISGIATLSTPFLQSRQFKFNALSKYSGDLAILGGIIVFIVFCMTPYLIVSYLRPDNLLDWLVVLGLWCFINFVIPIAAYVFLFKPALMYLIKASREYIPDCSVDSVNVLVVRASGDEASGVLTFFHTISWLIRIVYGAIGFAMKMCSLPLSPFIRIVKVIADRNEWVGVLVGAPIFLLIVFFMLAFLSDVLVWCFKIPLTIPFLGAYYLSLPFELILQGGASAFLDSHLLVRIILLLYIFSAFIVSASLMSFLVFIILFVILFFLRMPFGFYWFDHRSFFKELMVESCPIGVSKVLQLKSKKEYDFNRDLLWHSDPCISPEAIDYIIDWINSDK